MNSLDRNKSLINEFNRLNNLDKERIEDSFDRGRDIRYKQQVMAEFGKEKLNRFNRILLHDLQEETYSNMGNRLLNDISLIETAKKIDSKVIVLDTHNDIDVYNFFGLSSSSTKSDILSSRNRIEDILLAIFRLATSRILPFG